MYWIYDTRLTFRNIQATEISILPVEGMEEADMVPVPVDMGEGVEDMEDLLMDQAWNPPPLDLRQRL